MDKTPSFVVFYEFLKKKKKLGVFMYYLTHDVVDDSFDSNRTVMRRYMHLADTAQSSHLVKEHLGSIIGNMHNCKGNGLSFDYLYFLYKEWIAYLNKNWSEIYDRFLEIKQEIEHGKNIRNG